MSAPRLAIVTTHPVQYYAPLFRLLAERGAVRPHVFYGWRGAAETDARDPGFGTAFAWDIPLLEGTPHSFVENVAADPGSHHAAGIDGPSVVAEIEAFRPDAVLVYGWRYRSHRRVLKAFHGRVPVLFRGDSTLLDEQGGVGGTARRLARRLMLRHVYRDVDVALVVGRHNRAYFRAHGLDDDALVWAPHSVDNARFADPTGAAEAEAQRWRASLGVPDGAPTVVFAGKLSAKKAPDVLLKAVLAGPPELHLVVVGSGPLEGALRARAAAEAPSRVHFVGFQNQSQMPLAYRLGDALVLPSRGPGETWGLAVNEAFACGRPAIVSDRVGCAPDLVVDGETGYVVPAGDVSALTAALARLAADPARTRAMGAAAARLIDAWSLDRQADAVEAAVLASLR